VLAAPAEIGALEPLRRYERWRKAQNMLSATAFDALDRLFSNSNAALGSLRSAGLELVNRLPLAKTALARRALGLAGEIPVFYSDPERRPGRALRTGSPERQRFRADRSWRRR
jgi:hypothetical protein